MSADVEVPLARLVVAQRIVVGDASRTVLLTSLVDESLIALFCSRPWRLVALLRHLLSGRAAFRRALAGEVAPEAIHAPVNEPLLDWLDQQRAWGSSVSLSVETAGTAARILGQRAADFEELGRPELAALELGGNFTYVGTLHADPDLWARCRSAVLVGDVASLRRRLPAGVNVVAEFPRAAPGPRAWRRALRLHQWAKNLLIFVPLLLSGLILDLRSLLIAAQAFVAFGLLASATYIINDLYDLPNDRRHRVKRRRPFASGELGLRAGLIAVPLLLVGSMLAMSGLHREFREVAGLYFAVTLAYSMNLKRQPILDVIVLAGLFTLRLLAGILAVGTVVSPWLLAFSMFFFGALATIKRFTECAALQREGLREVHGRGYRAEDAAWLMSMGAACGFASIIVFCIYLVDAVPQSSFVQHAAWMWPICPILAYWMGRIWLLASRGEMREDPIAFALRDRLSLGLGLLVAVIAALAVF